MANSRYLTTAVEDEVRHSLSEQYQTSFHRRTMRLQTGGEHEFGAVSDNGRVVASIKTASPTGPGERDPAGKVVNCFAELYFLSLVRARRRLLVLTSAEFCQLFRTLAWGKVAAGIEIVHIPLTAGVQARVSAVQLAAGNEAQPVLDATELRGVGSDG
jgi:hypothetical protein